MARWKNMRFRTKLFTLFILLSTIPSLLIGTTAYRKSAELLEHQTRQDLSVILDQLMTSVERQISDFDRFTMLPYFLPDFFSFLNKPYVSPDQWGTAELNAQKTMARLMSAYPSINSSISGLMIYGMNGTVNGYRMNGPSAINPDENVREDAWYKEVLESKGGFVTTGVKEIRPFKGSPFKAIIGARMLRDENFDPLGVIAIFISPDFIPKIVRSLELPGVQVIVMDRERQLVYASETRLAKELKSVGVQEKRGSWEQTVDMPDGKRTFSGVFRQSEYLGWKIYMGVDRDAMLSGSRSIRNFTLVIVISLVFLAAGISWLLARSLSKPLYRLIRSMREVEKGKFSVPASPEREDEIGRLESSYGRMVLRLDEMIHSIEEKERQKRLAELYALRARIQPHFLYNTLNSIRMLAILQQSTQIAKLIQSLNKLLHANMKLDNELVTLEEEIRLLRDYAALMDLRYTNVFDIRWNIPPEVLHAAVPPMLLQPVLENAIFHGAKGLERKLNIEVAAKLEGNGRCLTVTIRDDGVGFEEEAVRNLLCQEPDEASAHIGLLNVRERIRLRFGDEYGLRIERDEGMTTVALSMPYKTLEPGGDVHVESAGR
ncbi:sensor histidine kinase [Cohnella laeviribosi]|uniref:sensor histidine kinase n=1 Tax=Cohnella laeviribosi TaxID=380174 RepID=UPI003D25E37F